MKAWLRKALGVDDAIEAAVNAIDIESAVEEELENQVGPALESAVEDAVAEECRDYLDRDDVAEEANVAADAAVLIGLKELEKAVAAKAGAAGPGPEQNALLAVAAAVKNARRELDCPALREEEEAAGNKNEGGY